MQFDPADSVSRNQDRDEADQPAVQPKSRHTERVRSSEALSGVRGRIFSGHAVPRVPPVIPDMKIRSVIASKGLLCCPVARVTCHCLGRARTTTLLSSGPSELQLQSRISHHHQTHFPPDHQPTASQLNRQPCDTRPSAPDEILHSHGLSHFKKFCPGSFLRRKGPERHILCQAGRQTRPRALRTPLAQHRSP